MARLNLESSIFQDPRFMAYIAAKGSPEAAVGGLVLAWIAGQANWIKHKMIPTNVWKDARLDEDLVKFNLVSKVTGGYYIRGSKDHFAWLSQRSQAGRNGGQRGLTERNETERVQASSSSSISIKKGSETKNGGGGRTKATLTPVQTTTTTILIKSTGRVYEYESRLMEIWKDQYTPDYIQFGINKLRNYLETHPDKDPDDFSNYVTNWLAKNLIQYQKRPGLRSVPKLRCKPCGGSGFTMRPGDNTARKCGACQN